MNVYSFFGCILFLIIQHPIFAQKIVKKDSTQLIPLRAVKYFSDQDAIFLNADNKLETNHLLHPLQGTTKESYILGNIGTELIPIAYQNTFYEKINSGRNALDPYFFSKNNIPYYLSNKAISQLDFTFFGNGNEVFSGFMSQNISNKLNLGIGVKRSNNKGYYQYNQTLHNNFYVTLTHQLSDFRTQVVFLYNDANIRENGGHTFGIFDSTGYKDWAFAPTQTNNAINKFVNFNASIKNRYLIIKNKDTSSYKDSILNKPIHSAFYIENDLTYAKDKNYFIDTVLSSNTSYYKSLTQDTSATKKGTYFANYSIDNTFSINSYLKRIGYLKAYNKLIYNDIDQSGSIDSIYKNSKNFIIAFGGELNMYLPYKVLWTSKIYKPISGYTQNDFLISSKLEQQIKNFNLDFKASYSSQLPGYMLNNSISSWSVNSQNLVNQKTIEMGLGIRSQKYLFDLKFEHFNAINMLYLNESNQWKQDISRDIWQVSGNKELKYKLLYLNTRFVFQNSIYSKFWVKQTFALRNRAFGDHLNYFIGCDVTLNAMQNTYNFNPIWMQSSDLLHPTTNKFYPIVDLFASIKISTVLLSLTYNNLLSSALSSGTYYANNYPIVPQTFYLKASWRFLE